MFGFALQVPAGWLARTTGYRNNTAIFIKPPAKKGLVGLVSSTILCLAHQAQPGENITAFTSKILDPRYSFEEVQSNLDWDEVMVYQGKADALTPTKEALIITCPSFLGKNQRNRESYWNSRLP